MERLELADDEDDLSYQRRRDRHRANYFMLDRGDEEDDHSFRQRLDAVADSFRQKRREWADSASQTGDAVRESAATVGEMQDAYASNPLIGGLIAAAIGAIAGTALPLTRTEDENLPGRGDTARDVVGEQKDKLVQTAREKKDELISQVQESGSPNDGTSTTGSIWGYSATRPEPVT